MRREACVHEAFAVGRLFGVVAEERGEFAAPAEAGDAEGESGGFVGAEGGEEGGDSGKRDGKAGIVHEGEELRGGAGGGEAEGS